MIKDSGLFSVALAGDWVYDAANTRHLVQLSGNPYPVCSIVCSVTTTVSPAPNWRGICCAQH
jgi:hypothetical protein